MKMSELLDQVEPLAVEMRNQVMDELGQRVASSVGQSWEDVRKEINRLDTVLQEANACRFQLLSTTSLERMPSNEPNDQV
jgi:hypothetical protein